MSMPAMDDEAEGGADDVCAQDDAQPLTSRPAAIVVAHARARTEPPRVGCRPSLSDAEDVLSHQSTRR
jgi:hypothetical protein